MKPQHDTTSGVHTGHGLSYDVHVGAFFGGRRRRVFTRLAAISGARPGDHVLDIGCGTGYFTRVMARAVSRNGTAKGVDLSSEAIERARRITRLPNCTFAKGSAEALDEPDRSYDAVVSSLMIHHLPETVRSQAFQEMFRVLRPGGRVLVAEFRPPTTRIGRSLVAPFTSPAMQNNPIHLLAPLAGEAGFEDVRNGDVRPWISYVHAVKPLARLT
jgi:ubiquinone/menaquinone biosynthesis C-methylase UbiE